MRWLLILAAILLLTPVQGTAQSTSTAQATPEQAEAIRSLYERLLTADAKRDTSEFRRILAPAYTFVPARGDTIMTREDRIRVAATDTSTSKVKYTLHGCRPAHCRYRATIRYREATADTVREFVSTAVFVQEGKQWLIVATHPSLVRRAAIDSAAPR